MKTAADQLSMWDAKTETKKAEIGDEEEGIVYTHIIDLVYEIIPLLVPFEANLAQLKKHMRSAQIQDGSSVMTSTTYEAGLRILHFSRKTRFRDNFSNIDYSNGTYRDQK